MKDIRQGWATSARKERNWHSSATQYSHDDLEEDQPYGSPIKVPPPGANAMFFMPTLQYDPCFKCSFFDQTQMLIQNLDTSMHSSHVGDTSGGGIHKPWVLEHF